MKGGQIRLDIRHTWSILPNFELSALSSDFFHNASFLPPFRIKEWTSEIIVVARNNNRCILILCQVCKRAIGNRSVYRNNGDGNNAGGTNTSPNSICSART